jgi:type IV secretion system protein TrbL
MNTGVIDQFLNTFTTYIDSGFGLLNGEVAFLATTLVTIDVTMAALFWAWSDEDIVAHLVKKTLYVGFFALLIGNFNNLAKIVFNSFAGLGLLAAGSSLSVDQFLQPGRIAQVGIDAGRPILQAISSLASFSSLISLTSWVEAGVLFSAWLIVLGSFFVLAVQLFVALVEFKLTTLAGFVLVPFGLFGRTAFLAERVLGNVVASGIKILVLAVIVGIGTGLFSQFTQGASFGGNQPNLDSVLATALAALSLLGLGIYCPSIATGLASGAPQLGAGAAAGTVSAVRGGAVAGWTTLRTGGSLAAGAGGLAASATRKVSSAIRGGATTPSNSSNPPPGNSGGPPPWARRMQRRQAMSQGLAAVGRALQSGGGGGGATSVNLKEDR